MSKYDNDTKRTWRGWAWNQVSDRVPKGSLVGVLCGDIAADSEVSKQKQLRIVGFDLSPCAVDTFRSKGSVAVCDDIGRQLNYIPMDGIILDELGGVSENSLGRFSVAMMRCKAVVANYLRGRDPFGAKNGALVSDLEIPVIGKDRRRVLRKVGKHRGAIAFALTKCVGVADVIQWGLDDDFYHRLKIEEKLQCNGYAESLKEAVPICAESYKPQFYSYQSKDSSQFFDSVAATGAGEGVPKWVGLLNRLAAYRANKGNLQSKAYLKKQTSSKRKAAAAKAVLTMKLQEGE